MTIDNDDLLNSIMESLGRIDLIKLEDIPNIDLYMDQLTTFMEDRLRRTTRYPLDDKILTKTMINNYAKNDLLPPPVRKKYSKDHIILLIFIYYYKNILSINDIQTLLGPIKERFHISDTEELTLSDIYKVIYEMEDTELEDVKQDILDKYEKSTQMFEDVSEEQRSKMQTFSFISLLAYDVYVKKLIIEKMLDNFEGLAPDRKTKAKKEKRNKDI
ncbi:MAG: DUF1836 domain-containing protein [Butyrivibrio sp.]|nr:DUF1836 domain-containing protein [Butyrivibrio sp.]